MGEAKPRVRNDPRRARTRARLLAACTELVREAGIGALTTVAIAARAGVHQPAFYAHFTDVDDCLRVAAAEVTTRLRLLYTSLYQAVIFERAPAELVGDALSRMYELARLERPFMEMFVRHRLDHSALGRELAAVVAEAKRDVRARFVVLATEMKIAPRFAARIEMLADLSVTAVLGGMELVSEDGAAPADTGWAVARQIKGLTDEAFATMAEHSALDPT